MRQNRRERAAGRALQPRCGGRRAARTKVVARPQHAQQVVPPPAAGLPARGRARGGVVRIHRGRRPRLCHVIHIHVAAAAALAAQWEAAGTAVIAAAADGYTGREVHATWRCAAAQWVRVASDARALGVQARLELAVHDKPQVIAGLALAHDDVALRPRERAGACARVAAAPHRR